MSWGYWGIVAGLVAMVGMSLACILLSSSKVTEPSPPRNNNIDVPRTLTKQAPKHHRQAA
jgi:hypothetical protein